MKKKAKRERFNFTNLREPERSQWFHLVDAYVLDMLYSKEIRVGADLDALMVNLWKKEFPEKAERGEFPSFSQITAVLSYFSLLISEVKQRWCNLTGQMKDYILEGNGLSFYGLSEISDGLKRAHIVGYLLKDQKLLFPDPKVSTIVDTP